MTKTCTKFKWLVTMLLLVTTMVMPVSTWAQEMYTVFDTETSTLTFKYDNSKPESTDTEKVYDVPTSTTPDWITNHASAIKTVVFDASFADAQPTSCFQWFSDCKQLTEIKNIENLNTANVKYMDKMFYNCSSLESLDLSYFNTNMVTSMPNMFNGCLKIVSLDLSNFNTAEVTTMAYMFNYCKELKSLKLSSNFKTDKVQYMSYMFCYCSKLESLDLSSFNTANVSSMSYMFFSCSKLNDLKLSSNFTAPKLWDTMCMFHSCESLESLDLSNFKTINVSSMHNMFTNCFNLKSLNLSNFVSAGASSLEEMFRNCWSLESLDLSSFNTSKVTNMQKLFSGCKKLTKLTLSSKFTNANVIYMLGMFEGCSSLKSIDLSKFNTSNVTTMSMMFEDCTSLTSLDLSSFNTANVTSMTSMFDGCSNLESLKLSSNFNTAKVKLMSSMFAGCSSLKSLDLSGFNTGSATKMNWMFDACSSLKSIDLSSFNTANVKDMYAMFRDCSSLTYLNLSSFNTANLEDMNFMFENCSQLTKIYVSDSFTADKVTAHDKMFKGCSSKLVGAIGYDSGIINKTRANYTTGYFSYGINTVDDWKTFANKVNGTNNSKICAGLMADITLTDTDVLPFIGNNGYSGTFDGLGHSISGLNFNSTFSALFAQNGGTIKNLGILNATIDGGAGGRICQTNSGTIESCFFMGTNTGSSQSAGSICQTNNGTITNCCYLASNDDGNGGKTEEQFKSGEVCYMLSKGKDDSVWGQQLGNDDYPVHGDYKVIKAAKGDKDANDNDTYWATFSNLDNDVTLSVPEGRTLAVYNATVDKQTMTLTQRDDCQVAKGEGVLLKSDDVYVNVKANETNELTPVTYTYNNLMATPSDAGTITADDGYKLYRLTYNNVSTKEGLGFYLSLVKDEIGKVDETSLGKKLKVTPGKAYLNVYTPGSEGAPIRGFVIGEDDNTTGIDVITINGIDINGSKVDDSVYDLMGRKVSKPAKGIYIKNGKKVIIK